jgi:predicted DCC family thiol-disulfide oxidoreductase YuxK
MDDSRWALLYDRDCGFCRWCTSKVLAWDRRERLRPVAIQDPEAQRLLAGMEEERRLDSWHLVTSDGEVHSAGAAFPPLLRELPGGSPLAALAERAPRLVERAYGFIARNRTPIGRRLTDGMKRRADRRVAAREGGG